jgi:hypothetical protein
MLLLWLGKQWLVVNVCSLVTSSILTSIIRHHGTAQTGDIQDDRGIDARYSRALRSQHQIGSATKFGKNDAGFQSEFKSLSIYKFLRRGPSEIETRVER